MNYVQINKQKILKSEIYINSTIYSICTKYMKKIKDNLSNRRK